MLVFTFLAPLVVEGNLRSVLLAFQPRLGLRDALPDPDELAEEPEHEPEGQLQPRAAYRGVASRMHASVQQFLAKYVLSPSSNGFLNHFLSSGSVKQLQNLQTF